LFVEFKYKWHTVLYNLGVLMIISVGIYHKIFPVWKYNVPSHKYMGL